MAVKDFILSMDCALDIFKDVENISGYLDFNVYNTIMHCIELLISNSEAVGDGIYYSSGHKVVITSAGMNSLTVTLSVDDTVILSYTRTSEEREVTFCNTNLMINDSTLIPVINLAGNFKG